MRELNGVINMGVRDLPTLKRLALIFDKFFVRDLTYDLRLIAEWEVTASPDLVADFTFLQGRNVVVAVSEHPTTHYPDTREDVIQKKVIDPVFMESMASLRVDHKKLQFAGTLFTDSLIRRLCTKLNDRTDQYYTPICKLPLSKQPASTGVIDPPMETVLSIALQALPTPDENCAWQDILDFKAEMHDKEWMFRRFLHTLATTKQSQAEIRDDLEWSLNEYTKEMDRFKLKRSISFIETYVIPTVEALESFKPSSFLKSLVAIKKRKIELLENEANTKGRECAYVFDARKRFGPQ